MSKTYTRHRPTTLGRQSLPHAKSARRWLARAREELDRTYDEDCSSVLPALIAAREAIAIGWTELDSVAETTPRNRRMKHELETEHRELQRAGRTAVERFARRCVIRR